jgi:transposase
MQTASAVRNEKLYVSLELSNKTWRLAFCAGQKVRQVTVTAGSRLQFMAEVKRAKEKLDVGDDAPVISCYEAGRDGFWIHRWLISRGVQNIVVDAASIETPRKHRRAKTDRIDAHGLVIRLIRWTAGDRTTWRVVRVPEVAEEDERRTSRERERLTHEQGSHWTRIWSLLKLHGVNRCTKSKLLEHVEAAQQYDGTPLPPKVCAEIRREYERVELIEKQREALATEWAEMVQKQDTVVARKVSKLGELVAVGPISSWILVQEFFGWRHFRNRRELAALAGLVDAPYSSGDMNASQGISKSGNRRVRWLMVELSWKWLQWQPESELSQWYNRRFAGQSKRMKRIGIVALARKLLIALWRFSEHGEVPAGAKLRAA